MNSVTTEQLVAEYDDGATLAELAEKYGFKSANSVYMRLRRNGFNRWRRNFGQGFINYRQRITCIQTPTTALTAA